MEKERKFSSRQEAMRFLERKRKKSLALLVLGIILASIVGSAGFGLVLASMIAFEGLALGLGLGFGALLFLGLMPCLILLVLRLKPRYENLLYDYLAPFLFEKIRYQEVKRLTRKEKEEFLSELNRQIRYSFDSENESAFQGKIEDVPFFTLLASNLEKPSYGFSAKRKTNLSGRILRYSVGTSAFGDVLVRGRTALALFKKVPLKVKIPTESIAFDEKYDVLVEKEREGRRFLSSVRIAGIVQLNKEMGGIVNVYFRKKDVLVFFQHYETAFHLGLTRKVDESFVEAFRQELLLPYRIFKAMDLKSLS